MKETKTQKLVKGALFSAIIIAMTVIPYTGYIAAGPIEITTLHIPVIIAACFLGPKYGAVIGGVWGLTNLARAFTNPLFLLFTNPLISVVPRIFVGLFTGLAFWGLSKTKLGTVGSSIVSAIVGSLTNTVLVLTALFVFGNMISGFEEAYKIFEAIWGTLISVNGVIELVAAIVIVPAIVAPLTRSLNKSK